MMGVIVQSSFRTARLTFALSIMSRKSLSKLDLSMEEPLVLEFSAAIVVLASQRQQDFGGSWKQV